MVTEPAALNHNQRSSLSMPAQTIKAPVDVDTSPKVVNPLNPKGIKP
jgi:hypothetical protein